MKRLWKRVWKTEPAVSESEVALFGGPLRYDLGWVRHEYARLDTKFGQAARMVPTLVGSTLRLAWRADRRALLTIGIAEVGQGLTQAAGLLVTNQVIQALLKDGDNLARLHAALPALIAGCVIAVVGTILACLSTACTGRLEPKVERLATEQFLEGATRAELEAIEDGEFRSLLDSAYFGAQSSRAMIGICVAVVNGVFSLVAAAGVVTVLSPVLLPLLLLIALPRGWGAMHVGRRRYASRMQWIEHERAKRLVNNLITTRDSATEVRVHQVGRFLLDHFRTMGQTAEAEQTRLADGRAVTELIAAAMAGLATAATFAGLGALWLTGHMSAATVATAALAIRTGSASLGALVDNVLRLHEESLYVRDLDRFRDEAERRAIPTGGEPVSTFPDQITFENVSFTYPDRDTPALRDVSLTFPRGAVIALVGANGSGKTTAVKLLAGLHRPTAGRVLWGPTDLVEADRADIFQHVAVLDQGFQRWPFTLRTNIQIGQPERNADDDITRAAAYSGADKLATTLPRGLSTLLARQFRGGQELSGGQWQTVGQARLRHRQASLVIADEPTSALDPEAEIESFERIRRLADEGKTVVLVSHRMAGIQHADIIYVLDQGHLVESGTHQELMALPDSQYRRMYLMQAQQYGTVAPVVLPSPSANGDSTHATSAPD
ncbi:ABC transporter related protein [Streptomyces davaonensis JCM 4913]|uniref:ABC transporter related protein n=1 Tax=Streptomyces davaonensis (strain DSM 101723 / JCM 4913 / KCC S-0913 / 768) TaxID=1214101 RepID=K4R789_STRDJ|nr:ABC transporter ATP-binding protein [Streptomyces davaonensis]CCK32141.1 ABC transporter related protein [Streptomyces davaonensis JCM 4913]